MLRKQKRQLRYAADQLIDNPRRNSKDESHLDLVHLKRRGYLDDDSTVKKSRRSKKSKAESVSPENQSDPLSPLASGINNGAATAAESRQSDSRSTARRKKLPHPDDASVEFDELDELLLADEDEELEAAIRQRLRNNSTRVYRPNRPDRSRSDDPIVETDRNFAAQRQEQIEASAQETADHAAEVIDAPNLSHAARLKQELEADEDRKEVELVRAQRQKFQQQIENDRIEIQKAQRQQAAILERAEEERAELQESIEAVREKARQAELERAEIVKAIEKDRLDLSRKLDHERELARKAEAEREGLQKKTEQQRIEIRDAQKKQREEAARLASEAGRLEREARQLENNRLEIQKKAERERLEVEKLLAKEREQVRQVSEQWLEIQERAGEEREKIRNLVDSDTVRSDTSEKLQQKTAFPAPPPAPLRHAENQTPPLGSSSRIASSARADAEDLSSADRRDRQLREQILKEQAIENLSSDAAKSRPADAKAPEAEAADALSAQPRIVSSTSTEKVQPSDSEVREEPARTSAPTPNRFSDASGAVDTPSVRRKSENSTDTGMQLEWEPAAVKTDSEPTVSKLPSVAQPGADASIPVLKSTKSSALTTRPASRRISAFRGVKSMALTMAVFVVVLVGSSLAFFGFLNLGVAQSDSAAVSTQAESDSSGRVAQIVASIRNRVFPSNDSTEPSNDGDVAPVDTASDAVVESAADAMDVDNPQRAVSVAENAPETEQQFEQLAARAKGDEVSARPAASAADVLRGRVVTESNSPVGGVAVTALARKFFIDPKGSSGGVNYRTRTDESGNFSLRLPPGEEYRVVTDGTHQLLPKLC